jgi:hypothetical protein
MLVVEFGLGVWVNLYASFPAADQGGNITTGFARAIANGPIGLSIHAIVGALLIISATTAVVRAALVKRRVLTAVTSIGLLAVVFAALSGARFIGDSASGTSMSMTIGAAAAMICYALILFITPSDAPAEMAAESRAAAVIDTPTT